MSEEPKFELTWVQRTDSGESEPRLRFEVIDEANRTSVMYGGMFAVWARPRCSCLSVCVDCGELLPDGSMAQGPLRSFWIDVRKRGVEMTSALQAEPDTLRLAKLVSARMDGTAWEDLCRWFWTAKIRAIETAEVSEIEITDLPDADDGRMVPFVEVFPLGLGLYFTLDGATWAADEAYCVQPGCKCAETVLSFLLMKDAGGGKPTVLKDVPGIRYNYRSQTKSVLAPGLAGTPPVAQLLEALRIAYPSLDLKIELHHRILQFLYSRHDLQRSILRNEHLEAELQSRKQKVGRNDPCPCGSRKKYKKCCGA